MLLPSSLTLSMTAVAGVCHTQSPARSTPEAHSASDVAVPAGTPPPEEHPPVQLGLLLGSGCCAWETLTFSSRTVEVLLIHNLLITKHGAVRVRAPWVFCTHSAGYVFF